MAERMIAKLQDALKGVPIVINVVFGFLLAAVEKMLKVEFTCPCNPKWNILFTLPFFVIPAIIVFLVMNVIQGCKSLRDCFYSLLPAMVWLVVVLTDGQYVVCLMTTWSGRFVSVDKTILKWCEPTNATKSQEKEFMDYSRNLFISSQGIGMGLLGVLCLAVCLALCVMKCMKESANDQGGGESRGPEEVEMIPKC